MLGMVDGNFNINEYLPRSLTGSEMMSKADFYGRLNSWKKRYSDNIEIVVKEANRIQMAADSLSLHCSLVSREMLTEVEGAQKSLRCVQMRAVKLPILGIGDLFARELEVRWKSLNMPGPSLPLGVSSSPNSITNHGTEDHKQHPSPSAQSHPLPCAETQLPEENPYARAGETSESAPEATTAVRTCCSCCNACFF